MLSIELGDFFLRLAQNSMLALFGMVQTTHIRKIQVLPVILSGLTPVANKRQRNDEQEKTSRKPFSILMPLRITENLVNGKAYSTS